MICLFWTSIDNIFCKRNWSLSMGSRKKWSNANDIKGVYEINIRQSPRVDNLVKVYGRLISVRSFEILVTNICDGKIKGGPT